MKRAIPVLLIALAAAGCGSSSSSGESTTTASNNRTQVAECMRKQGVILPDRPRGASGPTGPRGPSVGAGGFLFGGGGGAGQQRQRDPKFEAAAKKCGLNVNARQPRVNNAQFRLSIQKFVTCVRKNGYPDMPAPNFSGNGPVFDASKVNRNDPKFTKAATKCQSLLATGAPPAPQ